MDLNDFLLKLSRYPDQIEFNECIQTIDQYYEFSATSFRNGIQLNEAGQNNGSCKIFAFAQIHQLDELQTLACFGDYYQIDVLQNPDGQDHQNIRQFMLTGWPGIFFSGETLKSPAELVINGDDK